MDREQALHSLALLRKVVEQTRDDTALQNWGVIWMVHAVSNGGGFTVTNILLHLGYQTPWPFVGIWTGIIIFNIGSIFVLKTGSSGTRSFVERQLWCIWMTFIGAVMLVALVNYLLGDAIFRLAPIIGVLSAVGFSSMGALIERRFYVLAGWFAAVTLAMAWIPQWQFLILGSAWALTQGYVGYTLHREKRRRLRAGGPLPTII